MEKHWKEVVSKSICDYFFEAQKKCTSPEDVPPVIATPHHYLVSIYRNKIHFVAVLTNEVSPLYVIEFLHRIVDLTEEYFGSCTETSIKNNFAHVYELLDEILDCGLPLATENSVLKELLKHTKSKNRLTSLITKDTTKEHPVTQRLSHISWRPLDIHYRSNAVYFDVIEEIDCIIDASGMAVLAEIQGRIECCSNLSGMPDLTMNFVNPALIDDVSFHPCVRIKCWEGERVLSFVPPDGKFKLISYHLAGIGASSIPIHVKHNIKYRESGSGRFELTVTSKNIMDKFLENVTIECVMPKSVINCILTPSQGKYTFDPVHKVFLWTIGKMENKIQNTASSPTINGNIILATGQPAPESTPTLNISFKISQLALSGIRVKRVDLLGETYKAYKGVKYLTTVKDGRFQIRT